MCVCVCVCVCDPVDVWENSAQPVLDDWSLLQDSVGPDQAAGGDTTVTHPEPPPPWNTTSVRTAYAHQPCFLTIHVFGLIVSDSGV